MEVEISSFCDHVETVVLGTSCVAIEHNLTSPHVDGDIALGPYHESSYVPVYSKGSKLETIFETSPLKRSEDA